jgi:hypothetical protein
MAKGKKAQSWEEIDQDTKTNITVLREKEKMLLEKSGYKKWKKLFFLGYCLYASAFFSYIIFKKKNLNTTNLFVLFFPTFPYGFLLTNLYFDKDAYKEYYLNHLELNRLIKKTSKSSEYK